MTQMQEGATRLTDWGVIRAAGEDAATFLHGQLSNDMTGLDPGRARLAAYCTAKGRMLASFVVCRSGADLLLACHASVLPATLKRLNMFVLRAKVKLSDASNELALLGLAGPSAHRWLGPSSAPAQTWDARARDEATVIALPKGSGDPEAMARWLWIGPSAGAERVLSELPALDLAHWQWLEVHSAVVPIVAATVEQFVPQMINYELVGGVNFKKGCYPGQEVVARSQYLGKLKRRGTLVHGTVEMVSGQEVFWSQDPAQPSGMVAAAATAPQGGWEALVELKTVALDAGSLHLGAANGALLTPQALPYVLPQDAA